MKRVVWITMGLCLATLLPVSAQNIAYRSLKDFLAGRGDTIYTLKVERRTRSQVMMTGGADYRIVASESEMKPNYLSKRAYLIKQGNDMYINCKKLRFKKMRFGSWFAPAILLQGNIYFIAVPLGTVAAGETMDVKLGGTVGDAIAASSLVSKRVSYEVDVTTGEVSFVGKDRMQVLLKDQPDILKAYLREDSESASVTMKYLIQLRNLNE